MFSSSSSSCLLLCYSLFPFYFPSLVASLPLSCSPHSPPRLTHTHTLSRTDLTISPIQPPKSNYHGQNRVIKSNGLLYEVHTQKQNKSFSTLIHNILFVAYLLLPMINFCYIVLGHNIQKRFGIIVYNHNFTVMCCI